MEINKYIDHTLLKRDATKAEIDKILEEAIKYNFKTVCIHPIYVEYAKEQLKDSEVEITTVIGFPFGSQTIESKIFEGKDALAKGADELDFVITVSKLHDKDEAYLEREIKEIREATKGNVIKLILETALLNEDEKRYISKLAVDNGWDFIKTSTGLWVDGATVEDVKLMKEIAGEKSQVKASGGVRSYEDAIAMIEAGATRLGTSAGADIMQGKVSDSDY